VDDVDADVDADAEADLILISADDEEDGIIGGIILTSDPCLRPRDDTEREISMSRLDPI